MFQPTIGYIGVDVLNNATICNEADALVEAGAKLDVVSVHKIERPTYYRAETLGPWSRSVHSLYPLRFFRSVRDVAIAPFVFGRRFFATIVAAFTMPVEGPKQRWRTIAHLVPAISLALYWRSRKIRHIHAHWAHTATTVGMHAAELLGVPFSFTGHANDLFVYRGGLVGKLRRAKFVVCISEFHRRFYLSLGADPAKLAVVYCGIDMRRYADLSDDDHEIVIPPRILGVGRLVEKKGFTDLVAACARLRDRGVSFSCLIAGSGPEEASIQARIDAEGLGDWVRVTGEAVEQESLPGLIRSARMVALPCVRDRDGDMDGLPQVLIEAMACSVPVVSTRLVGIPDLVRTGIHGQLVEPGDVNSLAEAMETLLLDSDLAESQGREGADWAREHFGRDETVRRLIGLFEWSASGSEAPMPESCVRPAPGSALEYESRSTDTWSRERSAEVVSTI